MSYTGHKSGCPNSNPQPIHNCLNCSDGICEGEDYIKLGDSHYERYYHVDCLSFKDMLDFMDDALIDSELLEMLEGKGFVKRGVLEGAYA